MIEKDVLAELGIDPSIPDTLALTTTKEKRVIVRRSDANHRQNDHGQERTEKET